MQGLCLALPINYSHLLESLIYKIGIIMLRVIALGRGSLVLWWNPWAMKVDCLCKKQAVLRNDLLHPLEPQFPL